MINKKIIKDLANWSKKPKKFGKFDLQLFAQSKSTELEMTADLQEMIDNFKTLRQDRALKKKKTEGFLVIPKMLEVILELHLSFQSKFKTKEGREINCEKYGVLEEDFLKTILAVEEEYEDYEKWLENQMLLLVIRYQVNGKNYLLLAEADKELNDPSQKYISQAISALRREKNFAYAVLEGVIKQKTTEELAELELERTRVKEKQIHKKEKKLADFTGSEMQIKRQAPIYTEGIEREYLKNQITDIMMLTGANYTEAEKALAETKDKRKAIKLINTQKRQSLFPKADEQKAPVSKLNTPEQEEAKKAEELAIKLSSKYISFELKKIKAVLLANQNNIEKTEKELNDILLFKASSDLQEKYPFVSEKDIEQILKNEGSLEEARKILEIENTIRQNEYKLFFKKDTSTIISEEEAQKQYYSIVEQKGLYSKEADNAHKIWVMAMDKMKSHSKEINPQKWNEDKKKIRERLSYINKRNLTPKKEQPVKRRTEKIEIKDRHGHVVGTKLVVHKE